MLERYKRTFWGMQCLIAAVTLAVFLLSRVPAAAGLFFTTMQVSALVGASWAARLKRKIETVPMAASRGS